jgi:hypothetical protein
MMECAALSSYLVSSVHPYTQLLAGVKAADHLISEPLQAGLLLVCRRFAQSEFLTSDTLASMSISYGHIDLFANEPFSWPEAVAK